MIANLTRILEYRPIQGFILGAMWLISVAWIEGGTVPTSGLSRGLFGMALVLSLIASIIVSIPESDLSGVLVGMLAGGFAFTIESVTPNAYSGTLNIVISALQVLFGLIVGFVLSMTERALLALAAESSSRILFGMLIALISGLCCGYTFLLYGLIFFWPPD